MSGVFLSTGTHEVRVEAFGTTATIDTLSHTVRVDTHGQQIVQAQCKSAEGVSAVQLRLAPAWLGWLLGERLTIQVRIKP